MARKPVVHPVWDTAPFELADAVAIKAVAEGKATSEQQIRALNWITNTAGRLNRMSFQPDSERASCFAEGRRFVGVQIRRLVRTQLNELRDELGIKEP